MVDKEKALVRRGNYTPALVEPISTIKKAEYFAVVAILTGAPLEIAGGGLPGLLLAAGIGSAAFYFGDEIRAVMQRVPLPKIAQLDRLGRLTDRGWWLTGKRSEDSEEVDVPPGHEQGFGDDIDAADDYSAPTEKLPAEDDALFPAWNPDDTGGIARLTIEQIVSHIEPNSYRIYIGRSLTKEGNPAVSINTYKQHFRFMGASQRGKSSMIAAFLDIVTRTHDKKHVLVAILDKEDQTGTLFADLPHIPTLQIGSDRVKLHARTNEQVLEYLTYIVAVMEVRYQLGKQHMVKQPILLVYIEEFLSLKNHFKARMERARSEEKEEATADYKTLVYCINELAGRGLKARVQLLLSAQVEYADDDFKEAMASISCGFSFCVRPSAAQAAGFRNAGLLKQNAKDNKVGQAVVETPDCNDLVLAPEFDLEARLIKLEESDSAIASNVRPLRPDLEPAQRSIFARNERLGDTQNALEFEAGRKVFARTESPLRPDLEPTQAAQQGATGQKYRLGDDQVKMFLALYPEVIPNKDKALEKIGANSAYRAHANELIQQHRLDTRKQG